MAAKQIAAAKSCKPHVHALLTGPPGVGKTTLIRKVCSELQKHSIVLRGFYTEEVREGGREGGRGRGRGPRVGFDVVTLDGKRGPLARVGGSHQAPSSGRKPVYVGKYQVDVDSFEQIALPTLQMERITDLSTGKQSKPEKMKTLFVIDEIGKMELFSREFVEVVKAVFQCPDVVVLATLPIAWQKSHWLVEELRHRPDCMLYEISERTRDHLVQEVTDFLLKNLPTA